MPTCRDRKSGRIVEGAARLAETGGIMSGVKDFFATYAPGNFAVAAERSGVAPAALGARDVVFFVYSARIGVFALGLSLAVLHRQEREVGGQDTAAAATKPAH